MQLQIQQPIKLETVTSDYLTTGNFNTEIPSLPPDDSILSC